MKLKINIFFFWCVLLSNNIFSTYDHDLDYYAVKYGTDKSSKHHNYTAVYETYFSSMRNKKINLLEIGLGDSLSARMWEDYFPNATFYFIDKAEKYITNGKKLLTERSNCFLVDQGNKKAWLEFIKKVGIKFDVIIDDGGHLSKNQIISFEVLFPYVKSGGIYIIEDLNHAYWRANGGYGDKKNPKAGPGTSICFLKYLIDELNYVPASYNACSNINYYPESWRKNLNYYQEHIKAIHFYPSLCLIFKR